MLKNNSICYDPNLQCLELKNGEMRNTVEILEGKYGIKMSLDINRVPISILIPEPEILFGFNSNFLRHFECNYFT